MVCAAFFLSADDDEMLDKDSVNKKQHAFDYQV